MHAFLLDEAPDNTSLVVLACELSTWVYLFLTSSFSPTNGAPLSNLVFVMFCFGYVQRQVRLFSAVYSFPKDRSYLEDISWKIHPLKHKNLSVRHTLALPDESVTEAAVAIICQKCFLLPNVMMVRLAHKLVSLHSVSTHVSSFRSELINNIQPNKDFWQKFCQRDACVVLILCPIYFFYLFCS